MHPDVKALERTSRVITAGTWFIIGGVILYSLMVTTPFVAAHSPKGDWQLAAPVLGLMMDAAFVMSLQADSVLARHGVTGLGPWPRAFRWFTGLGSLFLNVWVSVQASDWTGTALHALAPLLLLFVSEVGPVWRASMARLIADAELAAAEAKRAAINKARAERRAAESEAEAAESEPEEFDDAEVTELFPEPPRQPRAGSAIARGLELMKERDGNLTTSELVSALNCTTRHAQNIVKRYEEIA